jgi:hypothetical protein
MQKNIKIINKSSLKNFIYKDNYKDFLNQKIEFEKILTCGVNKEIFEILYFNSIVCPNINILNKEKSNFIQDLFLESKGNLPVACKWLYKKNSQIKLNLDDKKILNISNELNKKGYYVIENFYDKETIETIKKELDEFKYFATTNIYEEELLKNIKYEDQINSVFASNLTSKIIKKDTCIHKFITSDFIKKVSQYYFETKPCIVGVTAIHTKAKNVKNFNDLEKHTSAQFFHYDQAHLKFLKFFLYLNDINQPEDGSHCYIEGSHENNLKFPKDEKDFEKSGLRRLQNGLLTGNIKDEWIKKNYHKDKIVDFCFPGGTLIVENTTGVHKGNNCTTKPRDMISIIVSLSSLSAIKYNRIPVAEIEENDDYLYNYYFYPINQITREYSTKTYNSFNKSSLIHKIKYFFKKLSLKFS